MDSSSRISSKEKKKMKQKFISAKSVSEMLESFKYVERCLDESDLGLWCWILAQKLHDAEYDDYEKARELYLTCRGDNSKKIAECSRKLRVIHNLIGETGTAFEHNRLSQKLSKELGCTSLSIAAEIDGANLLRQLGRFEESVQVLRDIIPLTEKNSRDCIVALTYLAETLIEQKKFAEAKACAEIACGLLGERKNCTLDDGMSFMNIPELFNELGELETAISLMRKVLPIMQEKGEFPISMLNPLLGQASGRLIRLLRKAGKAEDNRSHIEVDIERMKKSFGSKHVEVGAAYLALGFAYLDTNKLQLSAQALSHAKHIFDESLGPNHDESINVCKGLYLTHLTMGSYSLAISDLEEMIAHLKVLSPSAQEKLDEAAILMAEVKEMASGDISAKASPSCSIWEPKSFFKENEVAGFVELLLQHDTRQ